MTSGWDEGFDSGRDKLGTPSLSWMTQEQPTWPHKDGKGVLTAQMIGETSRVCRVAFEYDSSHGKMH